MLHMMVKFENVLCHIWSCWHGTPRDPGYNRRCGDGASAYERAD